MFGMMALWLLLPAAVVWWVLDQGQTRPANGGGRQSALRILEERFARGDIDAEEFRARRAAIEAGPERAPTA